MNSNSFGILGLGSRATAFYINQLDVLYKTNASRYPALSFKLLNTNFEAINALLPDKLSDLKQDLTPYMQEFIDLGIDSVLVPNITLFETLDLFSEPSTIIHPVKRTIAALKAAGEEEVLLFASRHSMESTYISTQFTAQQIKVSIPNERDRQFIDAIRIKVYQNKETVEDLKQYQELINTYKKDKAVVIGCTELSIALQEEGAGVYDMARIQINALFNSIHNSNALEAY